MSLNGIQEKFLEKNTIFIEKEIDRSTLEYVSEAILKLYSKGSPDITVLIASGGGLVGPGLAIFDLLNLYRGKKTAIVAVSARSMAAIILQACDERLATPHAIIMIHHINQRVNLDVLRNKKKMIELHRDSEKTQKKIDAILEKKTGKTGKEIHIQCTKKENELDMTPDEAIKFGLLDRIYEGKLP